MTTDKTITNGMHTGRWEGETPLKFIPQQWIGKHQRLLEPSEMQCKFDENGKTQQKM